MESNWRGCKNMLCIRPDNMGDLLMTGPALRALKETFGCKITVLTSSMAAGIAKLMPEIDEVIIFDVPWVKHRAITDPETFNETVRLISEKQFDSAVIFTVYSQNPLPTVMLAYLAGIPRRLAYCRENPYQLLTDWVPDQEPYSIIKHQVKRDLDLVSLIGAFTTNDNLNLQVNEGNATHLNKILTNWDFNLTSPWLILHPNVSDARRAYPVERWVAVGKEFIERGYQILITGVESEKRLCEQICREVGVKSIIAAGLFNLQEFVTLISLAPVVISVNTGTVHIAAAVNTPVVVLYALTNPQHTPWKVPCKVLPFSVPKAEQSKNEIIRYVNDSIYFQSVDMPDSIAVVHAAEELLNQEYYVHVDTESTLWLPHIPFQNQADQAS